MNINCPNCPNCPICHNWNVGSFQPLTSSPRPVLSCLPPCAARRLLPGRSARRRTVRYQRGMVWLRFTRYIQGLKPPTDSVCLSQYRLPYQFMKREASAHFLPISVGVCEFRATCLRSETRKKFCNERLMYVFCRFREKKRQIFRASARIWHAWRGDFADVLSRFCILSYSMVCCKLLVIRL